MKMNDDNEFDGDANEDWNDIEIVENYDDYMILKQSLDSSILINANNLSWNCKACYAVLNVNISIEYSNRCYCCFIGRYIPGEDFVSSYHIQPNISLSPRIRLKPSLKQLIYAATEIFIPSDLMNCIDQYLLEIATFEDPFKLKSLIRTIPQIGTEAGEGQNTEAGIAEYCETNDHVAVMECLADWALKILQPFIDSSLIEIVAVHSPHIIELIKMKPASWPDDLEKYITVECL